MNNPTPEDIRGSYVDRLETDGTWTAMHAASLFRDVRREILDIIDLGYHRITNYIASNERTYRWSQDRYAEVCAKNESRNKYSEK